MIENVKTNESITASKQNQIIDVVNKIYPVGGNPNLKFPDPEECHWLQIAVKAKTGSSGSTPSITPHFYVFLGDFSKNKANIQQHFNYDYDEFNAIDANLTAIHTIGFDTKQYGVGWYDTEIVCNQNDKQLYFLILHKHDEQQHQDKYDAVIANSSDSSAILIGKYAPSGSNVWEISECKVIGQAFTEKLGSRFQKNWYSLVLDSNGAEGSTYYADSQISALHLSSLQKYSTIDEDLTKDYFLIYKFEDDSYKMLSNQLSTQLPSCDIVLRHHINDNNVIDYVSYKDFVKGLSAGSGGRPDVDSECSAINLSSIQYYKDNEGKEYLQLYGFDNSWNNHSLYNWSEPGSLFYSLAYPAYLSNEYKQWTYNVSEDERLSVGDPSHIIHKYLNLVKYGNFEINFPKYIPDSRLHDIKYHSRHTQYTASIDVRDLAYDGWSGAGLDINGVELQLYNFEYGNYRQKGADLVEGTNKVIYDGFDDSILVRRRASGPDGETYGYYLSYDALSVHLPKADTSEIESLITEVNKTLTSYIETTDAKIEYLSSEISSHISGSYWKCGGYRDTCYGHEIGNTVEFSEAVIDLDNKTLNSSWRCNDEFKIEANDYGLSKLTVGHTGAGNNNVVIESWHIDINGPETYLQIGNTTLNESQLQRLLALIGE